MIWINLLEGIDIYYFQNKHCVIFHDKRRHISQVFATVWSFAFCYVLPPCKYCTLELVLPPYMHFALEPVLITYMQFTIETVLPPYMHFTLKPALLPYMHFTLEPVLIPYMHFTLETVLPPYMHFALEPNAMAFSFPFARPHYQLESDGKNQIDRCVFYKLCSEW